MIVRISGEDQYELPDADGDRLNQLEREVIAAVDAGSDADFRASFATLLDYVRSNGTRVGDEELQGSDVILPPADITLDEAGHEFTGEGLIPD
jgi:hypothetical protein